MLLNKRIMKWNNILPSTAAWARKPPMHASPDAVSSSLKNSSSKFDPELISVFTLCCILSEATSVRRSAFKELPSRTRKYCPGQGNCSWSKYNPITKFVCAWTNQVGIIIVIINTRTLLLILFFAMLNELLLKN